MSANDYTYPRPSSVYLGKLCNLSVKWALSYEGDAYKLWPLLTLHVGVDSKEIVGGLPLPTYTTTRTAQFSPGWHKV